MRYWTNCVLLVLVTSAYTMPPMQQPIVSDVTLNATLNNSVTLSCRPQNIHEPILWTRNTPTLQQDISVHGVLLNGFQRQAALSVGTGWNNLTIWIWSSSDLTTYFCQEMSGSGPRHKFQLVLIVPTIRLSLSPVNYSSSPQPQQSTETKPERSYFNSVGIILLVVVLTILFAVIAAVSYLFYRVHNNSACCCRHNALKEDDCSPASDGNQLELQEAAPMLPAAKGRDKRIQCEGHSIEKHETKDCTSINDLCYDVIEMLITKASTLLRYKLSKEPTSDGRQQADNEAFWLARKCCKLWKVVAERKNMRRKLKRRILACPQLLESINDVGELGVRGIIWLRGRVFVISYSNKKVAVFSDSPPFNGIKKEIEFEGISTPSGISACKEANEINIVDYKGKYEWIIDAIKEEVRIKSELDERTPVMCAINDEQDRFIYRMDGTRKAEELSVTYSINHAVEISDDCILVADREKPRVLLIDSNFQHIRVLLDETHFPVEGNKPWRLCYSEDTQRLFVGLLNRGVLVYSWKKTSCT